MKRACDGSTGGASRPVWRGMTVAAVAMLLVCSVTLMGGCSSGVKLDEKATSDKQVHQWAMSFAGKYVTWSQTNIKQIQADLPAIARAAEAVAGPIIEGKNLGVQSRALATELGGRAGGFYMYKGVLGKPGDVILFPIDPQPRTQPDQRVWLVSNIEQMKKLRDAGSLVIGIASYDALRRHGLLEDAKAATDHLLDNHTPAADGLFTDAQGNAIIPTTPVANALVAWAWSAELYAAMTRQGKTPAMYQSVAIPGARERNNALKGKRFEDEVKLEPVPAERLGRQYLEGVSELLNKVMTKELTPIVEAAVRLVVVKAEGGKAYIFHSAHYPPFHFNGSLLADPGVLEPINQRGNKFVAQPTEADAIVALGYCMPPYDKFFGERANYEAAGKGVVWVITDYDTKKEDLGPRDMLINQWWPAGDAVVDVPGYDVRIFPPSGVITQVIGWALTAEVQQLEELNQEHVKAAEVTR